MMECSDCENYDICGIDEYFSENAEKRCAYFEEIKPSDSKND